MDAATLVRRRTHNDRESPPSVAGRSKPNPPAHAARGHCHSTASIKMVAKGHADLFAKCVRALGRKRDL